MKIIGTLKSKDLEGINTETGEKVTIKGGIHNVISFADYDFGRVYELDTWYKEHKQEHHHIIDGQVEWYKPI